MPRTNGLYSAKIDLAYRVAAVAHAHANRKGTSLPYISHPVHVARLLERAGLEEHVVVAGILHDVLEDLEPKDAAIRDRFREVFPALRRAPRDADAFAKRLETFLDARFGPEAMALVKAVTEKKSDAGRDRPWRKRKLEQLAHLAKAPSDVAALKAADAFHNVQSILHDLRTPGTNVLKRFNAKPKDTVWYYRSVSVICTKRLEGPGRRLAEELRAAVAELEAAVDALPQ